MLRRSMGWCVGVGIMICVAIGLCSRVGFADQGPSKGDAAVALRSARLYLKQQLWDKAREQLEIAVKGDPGNAEAHYLLGSLYADQDMADPMNREFDLAMKLKPQKYDKDVHAWRAKVWTQHYNNGVRFFQKDKIEDAMKEFSAAAQSDPTRADSTFSHTYYMIGTSYLRLNQVEKGIDALRRATEMDPRNKAAFLNLGIAYHNALLPENALRAFDAAVRLDPRNTDAVTKLLMGYETLARTTKDSVRAMVLYDSAMSTCDRALTLDPKSIQVAVTAGRLHLNRAMGLSTTGRKAEAGPLYEEAEGYLRKALELDPKDNSSAYNLGLCYSQLERYDDAIAMYRKAVEIDPKDLDSWMQLGITQVRQKNYDVAIEAFKKVVEVKPDHVRAYEFLATVYANKDMPKEAKQAYEMAKSLKAQGKN